MNRRWGTVLVVALVILALLWSRGAARTDAPGEPSPDARAPSVPAASSGGANVPSSPSAPPAAGASKPKVHIPRAPRRATPPPPRAPAPEVGGMVDRREHPSEDGEAMIQVLRQQLDDAGEEIEPCIEQWMAADPGLEGKVMLGFNLDADGLQDVWIEDHAAVPDAMLSCFSEAIWNQDWSGITTGQLQVTNGYTFSADPPDKGGAR